MDIAELRFVCQEAAIALARKHRPVPPTVVLPGAPRTRLLTMSAFPDDDEARHALLAELAADEVTAKGSPAWGFVAEATDAGGETVVVVVYGARRHAPELTASTVDADDGHLVEFVDAEPLDPTAMPFLHPLQHAVDALPPLEGAAVEGGGSSDPFDALRTRDALAHDPVVPPDLGDGGLPQVGG